VVAACALVLVTSEAIPALNASSKAAVVARTVLERVMAPLRALPKLVPEMSAIASGGVK
jgi:hypothetical protein